MLDPSLAAQLRSIVGDAHFRDDQEALIAHSYDGTPMLQALPDAVIYPANTEQVSAIMKALSAYKVPLVSRGSGSNLCGGTVPIQGGVVMVMHRMNRILELDLENLTATVQPGIITADFIQHIESLGLFYPRTQAACASRRSAAISPNARAVCAV